MPMRGDEEWQLLPGTTFITEPKEAKRLLDELMDPTDRKVVAYDTETSGLDIQREVLIYSSLAWRDDHRIALDAKCSLILKPWLEDENFPKILHNANYDRGILANVNQNIELRGIVFDSMIAGWLLNENEHVGLKKLVRRYFGWSMTEYMSILKMRDKNRHISLQRVDPQLAAEYAAQDALATWRLAMFLANELEKYPTYGKKTLLDHMLEIEMPFQDVLYHMTRTGIRVNVDAIKVSREKIEKTKEDIVRWFNDNGVYVNTLSNLVKHQQPDGSKGAVKGPFNPNSDYHVRWLLFEPPYPNGTPEEKKCGCSICYHNKPIKMTSGGTSGIKKPSVDEEVLQTLLDDENCKGRDLLEKILEYKALNKVLSTYLNGINARTDQWGRVHTSFNQARTVTGRLSSSDPNLQNIPRPKHDKHGLRRLFIAQTGYDLIVADYAQVEMRLMAAVSGDPLMIESIRSGKDLHCDTVARIFNVPYEDVEEAKRIDDMDDGPQLTDKQVEYLEMRQAAKAIGFGIIYGMTEVGLATRLGCTREEATAHIKRYFSVYKDVEKSIERTVASAYELGYVKTLLGRYRRLSEQLSSTNRQVRLRAQRQAVNAEIQGSAADIIRLAQLKCFRDKRLRELHVAQILQVHDELVFECPEESTKEAMEIIEYNMVHCLDDTPELQLPVPLEISIHSAKCWADAK